MILRLLFTPDPAAGGGGADPKVDPPAAPDLAKQVADVLAKHGGDQTTAVRAILTELNTTRDQVASLTAKLPKEGHVVIDGDAHKLFGAYQAMGKPEELTAAIEAGKTATTELTGIKRAQHFSEVAKLNDYEASVLTTLAERDGLEIEIVETDGKDPKTHKPIKVKVASVKAADGKLTPLADYAEASWKSFLPALKVAPPSTLPPRGSPSSGTGSPRPPVVSTDQPRRSLVS